jgi:hypothetical protein
MLSQKRPGRLGSRAGFGDMGGSRCALGYGRYGMHIIASILLAAGSACIRMPEVERIAV